MNFTLPASVKPPFPYFGGKLHAASLIWQRLGSVKNYVAPFCGSLAVELNAPYAVPILTLNDLDGLLINFYRAVIAAPAAVAHHLNWPVSECDLFPRHVALVQARDGLTQRLQSDPRYYDVELAGWWCWGVCSWIGTGWCDGKGPWTIEDGQIVNIRKGDAGRGVNRQLPHLGDAGQGVNQLTLDDYETHLITYMYQIAAKLRGARLTCGNWSRVVTPICTERHGLTGILLDPPYGTGAQDYSVSGNADTSVSADAWAWAIANGANPLLRIAYCAYDDGREVPAGWTAERWKARKGYQSTTGASAANPSREIIYFSPHCVRDCFWTHY